MPVVFADDDNTADGYDIDCRMPIFTCTTRPSARRNWPPALPTLMTCFFFILIRRYCLRIGDDTSQRLSMIAATGAGARRGVVSHGGRRFLGTSVDDAGRRARLL